jgi:hypothetical protein
MRKPLPESRICRICGVEFKPTTPLFRCKECKNEIAREKNRLKIKELTQSGELIPYIDKVPEEMKGGKDGIYVKYRELQRMCSKMDRDEFRVYAKNKLNEIMENEKLWKYLTRDGVGETIPKKDVVKKPKLSKREKWIQKGDTRNLSWDEWERMGFGLEEDK